jgi:hypothetical protein
MRTICKFLLKSGWNDLQVFGDVSQVVFVSPDPATGHPAIWIEHGNSPGTEPLIRSFKVFGTGAHIDGSREMLDDGISPVEHAGSMIVGDQVLHIYERTIFYGHG